MMKGWFEDKLREPNSVIKNIANLSDSDLDSVKWADQVRHQGHPQRHRHSGREPHDADQGNGLFGAQGGGQGEAGAEGEPGQVRRAEGGGQEEGREVG